MGISQNDVVTIQFENNAASNTFIVDSIIDDKDVLLKHPLFPDILVKAQKDQLNVVQANLKDSSERSLDFANKNTDFLDYNTKADLEALCAYFVIRRKLTPRQKHALAATCGKIASIKFDGDVLQAIDFIKKNEGLLDEFNGMWYRNFRGLFSKKQPITSKKQKDAIFNIAGFVLAESETPTVAN